MVVDRPDDIGKIVHFHFDVAEDHLPVLPRLQRPGGVQLLGHAGPEAVVDAAREPDFLAAALIDLGHVALVDAVAEGDGEAVPVSQGESCEDAAAVLIGQDQLWLSQKEEP